MQLLRLEISVANSAVSPQRKPECYACPQFVNRPSIQDRMAHCDIDGEILVDLPDQSDEAGHRFKLPEFLLIEDFANGSHRPFSWTLDDGAQEDIAMVLTRKRGCRVQMDRAPVPTLRYDPGRACSKTRSPNAVGQKHAKFGGDAWTGLVLEAAWPDDAFQECPRRRQARRTRCREGGLYQTLQNAFPSFGQTEIEAGCRRDQRRAGMSSCKRPAGCNSTSIFPGSATAASVPSNGRNAKAGEVASAATHRQATNTQSLFDCVDAESFRNLVMSQLTQLGFRVSGGIPKYSRVARLPPSPRAAADPVLERRAMYALRKPLECVQCACMRSPQRRAHRGTPRHS